MSSCFIRSIPFPHHHRSLKCLHPHGLRIHPPSRSPRTLHLMAASDLVPQQPSPPLQTPLALQPTSPLPRMARVLRALYPFSRPHTIHGTLISILSLTLLATLLTSTPAIYSLRSLLSSLPPALLTNVYIVGLNQLHDVPLDRINKPHLPLPSGTLKPAEARLIIYASLLLSIVSLFISSTTALVTVVLGSVALGTAYSAPPLRLKRFAALASAAIMCVRGILVNTCFFLHASLTFAIPPLITYAIAFFTLFGTVIALLKDVPDISGDRMYGIKTFSVRLGGDTIFKLCVGVLVTLFLSGAGVYAITAFGKFVSGGAVRALFGLTGAVLHILIARWLWQNSRKVEVYNRESVTKYYMNAWKVFYLEYLLLPLSAL